MQAVQVVDRIVVMQEEIVKKHVTVPFSYFILRTTIGPRNPSDMTELLMMGKLFNYPLLICDIRGQILAYTTH